MGKSIENISFNSGDLLTISASDMTKIQVFSHDDYSSDTIATDKITAIVFLSRKSDYCIVIVTANNQLYAGEVYSDFLEKLND